MLDKGWYYAYIFLHYNYRIWKISTTISTGFNIFQNRNLTHSVTYIYWKVGPIQFITIWIWYSYNKSVFDQHLWTAKVSKIHLWILDLLNTLKRMSTSNLFYVIICIIALLVILLTLISSILRHLVLASWKWRNYEKGLNVIRHHGWPKCSLFHLA